MMRLNWIADVIACPSTVVIKSSFRKPARAAGVARRADYPHAPRFGSEF